MNPEHLLDAIGLLDDDLIREAEAYRPPRRDYSRWLSLAACLAVVLTLGYALTHLNLGMGGGAAPENQMSGGAASAPSGSCGATVEGPPPASTEGTDGSSMQGGGDWPEPSSPDAAAPQEPGANGGSSVTGDWLPAIRVDGVVYYWDTKEYIHLEPEEYDIRYTTSFINSWEPEEDGQANFLPIGLPYVVLDNGTVAVLHNEETNTWEVYDSVPPWEK